MTRLRASIVLLAFAFAFAGPLFASNGMCGMPCCKHAKTTAIQMPMCPLPQQCPQVTRDSDDSNPVAATPAPAQPIVHTVPAVVAVVVPATPLRHASRHEVSFASPTSERPLYLADSVFLI